MLKERLTLFHHQHQTYGTTPFIPSSALQEGHQDLPHVGMVIVASQVVPDLLTEDLLVLIELFRPHDVIGASFEENPPFAVTYTHQGQDKDRVSTELRR